jgi:hypothetical protein
MNRMKSSARSLVARAGLLGALVLALSAMPAAAQATGATDVDITLPDIVILHYFSNVDVTITDTALGTFLTGSAGDSSVDEGTATPAAGGFTQDLGMTPAGLTLSGDPSAAVLVLQNAWAVRAISTAGTNTQLSIANTDNLLELSPLGPSILVTGVAVDDGTSNGGTITFAAPGLVNPQVGDVELTLDISNATEAGQYVDGVYTLTATFV